MINSSRIHVLVAEDDFFQRMALLDFLDMHEYDVTPCADGQKALEALSNTNLHFDLILLDIIMPVVDGFEVLEHIQADQKLKKIPVVMMSSTEEPGFIGACIKLGAKDYIPKPIRVNTVRSLRQYLNSENMDTRTNKGLGNYRKLELIGKGAGGSVSLVERVTDGEKFALKTISLENLNEEQKRKAGNEVHLLQVLIGPTICRSYETYYDQNNIYIIMEYCEGGSLSHKVKVHSNQGTTFDPELILDWIAQLTLAIMTMHSKKILHRDLKSQNIFLRKNKTKLGDFGISKELGTMSDYEQTNCGTPYFMAPEVVNHEPYGQKADIWGMGCVLYELATLNKPFIGDDLKAIFKEILNSDFRPLPEDCDSSIKMLIICLLNKDPNKRPSVWDFANIKIIKERIRVFIENEGCQDMVLPFFQYKRQNEGGIQDTVQGETTNYAFQIERLDELAKIIREKINLRNIKTGWFKTRKNCINGADIVAWIEQYYQLGENEAEDMCQKLLENYQLYSVQPNNFNFTNLPHIYYQFQIDISDAPANTSSVFRGVPRMPLLISIELNLKIGEVLHISKEESANIGVQSCEFLRYLQLISELQNVNLQLLSRAEKIVFFANLYQAMYLHKLLVWGFLEEEEVIGFLNKLKNLFRGKKEDSGFYYLIGEQKYSLDIIKHGIIRGNKKPKGKYFKLLGTKDVRTRMIGVYIYIYIIYKFRNPIQDCYYYLKIIQIFQRISYALRMKRN